MSRPGPQLRMRMAAEILSTKMVLSENRATPSSHPFWVFGIFRDFPWNKPTSYWDILGTPPLKSLQLLGDLPMESSKNCRWNRPDLPPEGHDPVPKAWGLGGWGLQGLGIDRFWKKLVILYLPSSSGFRDSDGAPIFMQVSTCFYLLGIQLKAKFAIPKICESCVNGPLPESHPTEKIKHNIDRKW